MTVTGANAAGLAAAGPRDGETGAGIQIEPRLATHTGYLAHLASLRAEQCRRAVLPPGMDARDLAILSVLAGTSLSQAELGTLLDVNRTVMISVIDRLEAEGLVHRQRDPADRRRYALRITADGTTALDRMRESQRQSEQALTTPLTDADRSRLNELLRPLAPDAGDTLPQSLTSQTGFLLARVSRRLRGDREAAMRKLALKPRCVRMLIPLDAAQPCTQEQLASRLGVTSPTIMQAIDELHASGLILRDRNPADRREHQLRLTPDGETYLGKALTAEDTAQDQLAGRLGTAETDELNRLLTLIVTGKTEAARAGVK